MRSLDQIFRLESVSVKGKSAVPVPIGQKTTPSDERVDLKDLEKIYLTDGTINSGINKLVSVIMSGDMRLIGSEESTTFVNEFLQGVGTKGGLVDIDRLLELTFKHQAVYGRAFIEIIYDSKMEKPLDLDFLDPKKMDYAKNGSNQIVFDKFNNPVGWTETLPFTATFGKNSFKSDKPPSGVSLEANQIYFDRDRVVDFKMYEIGDGFYGVGLIEPVYKPSDWKMKMMDALTNSWYRSGFAKNVFRVGDQFHEPTPELMERTSEELRKSEARRSYAIPNYVEPMIMESKNPLKARTQLDFYIEQQLMLLGPKAFVTGIGEGTNKAVLSRMEYLYKLSLKDLIKRTTATIEKKIFTKLKEAYNLPDVPKIVWSDINLEELNSKAERLVNYVKVGLLTPDTTIEDLIRKYEGLPLLNESIPREDKGEEKSETEPKHKREKSN